MSYYRTIFYTVLTALGFLCFLHGLIHIALYLLDSTALFAGLRAVNWASLFIGSILSVFSYLQLAKPNPPISQTS